MDTRIDTSFAVVRRRTPLVGREREQQLCRELSVMVGEGQPMCLAIVGEPGIGKTRLADSVLDDLAKLGWATGRARADDTTTGVPLWCLQRSVQDVESSAEGGIDVVVDLSSEDGMCIDQLRYRLLERATSQLARLASAKATVLLWDDAAWADPSSLD